MRGSGVIGKDLLMGAALVLAVFVGCGGSSKTHRESGDGREGGGSGAGGNVGATSGTGTSGDSFGGSSNPNGGTGAIPPPGTSYCGGEPCDPPLACCIATGECFDPNTDNVTCLPPDPDDDSQGRRPCSSSAHCAPGEYCETAGTCRGTGHCQSTSNCGYCGPEPTSGFPSEPACRVCGCDGNTYPDPQTACSAGVNMIVGSTGAACGEPNMEGGAGNSSTGPRTFISCAHDGQCPSGNFCCTIASRCYPESDRDICITAPPGTRIACNTDANCADNEYCLGEGCTAPGGCVGFGPEDECGVTLEPVCGCDGTTYTSAACADSRGVRVDFEGNCDGGGGE